MAQTTGRCLILHVSYMFAEETEAQSHPILLSELTITIDQKIIAQNINLTSNHKSEERIKITSINCENVSCNQHKKHL